MPKLMALPTGPYTGNRLATEIIAKGVETMSDQLVLNSAIKMIGKNKASFDTVVKETNRIGESIHGRADVLSKKGSEDANRLKTIVDKAIEDVQQNTSKAMGRKTALIQAVNQAGSQGGGGNNAIESGKGGNINVAA